MPLIDTSAAEAIARALDSAPNALVDPKIWQELGRVHRALNEVAALTDLVNSPGASSFGGVPVGNHLQQMTVVTARAAVAIGAYRPVRLELVAGELRALYTGFPTGNQATYTRADAVAQADVPAGALGQFILKGIAVARTFNMNFSILSSKHSRLYAVYILPRAVSEFLETDVIFNAALPVTGVFLHSYSQTEQLLYFNPNRAYVNQTTS